MSLQIHQNRAIHMTFPLHPIIDAQHAWGIQQRQLFSAKQSQQPISADLHVQLDQQPRPGFPLTK